MRFKKKLQKVARTNKFVLNYIFRVIDNGTFSFHFIKKITAVFLWDGFTTSKLATSKIIMSNIIPSKIIK
jgi:hypothetical protein